MFEGKKKSKNLDKKKSSEALSPEWVEQGRGDGGTQAEGGQGMSEPRKAWKVGRGPTKASEAGESPDPTSFRETRLGAGVWRMD